MTMPPRPDRLARLRSEENQDHFLIRKQEESMARAEREMDHEMDELEALEERTEREIEEEWRREGLGQPPERPPAWPKHGG
jgi:hypothetical protein